MDKISLCLEPVFTEHPFEDRIRMAAEAGFKAVEFWNPSSKNLAGIAAAAASCGVSVVACCLGQSVNRLDRSPAAVAENVRASIAMAQEVGCSTLIGLAGEVKGRQDSQKNILIENLRRVADMLVKAGMTLVLEPLNSLVNHKGYYLDSSPVGFEIVKCVNCPNVRLLFDIYHMQVMEGNLLHNITENIEWIGHFHTAGVPGRHEPMIGEIQYPYIMKQIDSAGYDRYVGLEYWPTYDHMQSARECLAHLKI